MKKNSSRVDLLQGVVPTVPAKSEYPTLLQQNDPQPFNLNQVNASQWQQARHVKPMYKGTQWIRSKKAVASEQRDENLQNSPLKASKTSTARPINSLGKQHSSCSSEEDASLLASEA